MYLFQIMEEQSGCDNHIVNIPFTGGSLSYRGRSSEGRFLIKIVKKYL